MTDFFDIFGGYTAGSIAAACRVMQERGLTPADVLLQYDAYMARKKIGQIPRPQATPAGDEAVHLLPGEEVMGRCPDCGRPAAGKRLCPAHSKHFKTRLACTNEDCSWWGKSTRTPAQLRAADDLRGVEEQHHGND